jgi:phosphoglycerate kinase
MEKERQAEGPDESLFTTVNKEMSVSYKKLGIADVDLKGKRVFIRVDFNVPFTKGTTTISNTQRIDEALPTIQHALAHGAQSVVLASHLGRPDGKVKPEFSMRPVAEVLKAKLGSEILFLEDCVGPAVEAACANPKVRAVLFFFFFFTFQEIS